MFALKDFTTPSAIADFVIACALIIFIVILMIKLKMNLASYLTIGIILALLLICSIFELPLAHDIMMVLTVGALFIVCLSHIGTIRGSLQKLIKKKDVVKKSGPQKLVDRDTLYNEVLECVANCSKQKVGALITFEKHDNLANLTKNGTVINAPVKAELLQTIFYPGTRLHDGAVIIKENLIYAASVYYTPTTKALTGKYGSRHRAAIGISQISDSITIVVSEETGRVSIAQGGEIEPISLDDFIPTLQERMRQDE